MASRVIRGLLPAIAAGVVVAASSNPPIVAGTLLVAIGLATVRIAGERVWSLLPQGMMAAVLIAPDRVELTLTVAATASVAAAALRPERMHAAAINFASGIAGVALLVSVPPDLSQAFETGSLTWPDAIVLAAAGAAWFLTDTALWLLREPYLRIVYRDSFARLVRDWRVAVIIVTGTISAGALWHHSPSWAVATAALLVFLASRLADQVRRHRVLVDLTVQALGRLPEAAGVAQRGHSKNVTALAVAMGRAKGMAGRDMETLRRVALLHEVGLVSATKPEVESDGFMTSDVAKWGADLLAGNDEFRRETVVMRSIGEPYRTPGADPAEDEAGQIVRVACRAITMLEVDPVGQVMETLYADSIYSFDPRAIALIRPAMRLLGWAALPELA